MKNKEIIIGVILLSLIIFIIPLLVSAGDIEDLINSYSFNYSDGTINITDLADFMDDLDTDGTDDILFFNISIGSGTSTGDYTFYIDLEDAGTTIIGKIEKNVQSIPDIAIANISTEFLSLNMFNYTLRIYDSSDSLVHREGKVKTQQYGSYESGYTINNIEDENINNNLIRINLTINAHKTSTENITVFMKYNNSFISSVNETTLTTGLNYIMVDFDNETIKSTHYNGSYLVDTIKIGQKPIDVDHTTANYDYQTFSEIAYFKSFKDYFIDIDNDNLIDFLQINHTVEAKIDGLYAIESDIFSLGGRHLKTISVNQLLNTGENVVALDINGSDIYASQLNGPFKIIASRIISREDNNRTVDSWLNAHITNISSYRDFERPPLPDLNISMSVVFNDSDNLINITVANEGEAPAFNVFVDIFDANSSYKDRDSIAVLNVSDSKLFSFLANGTINESLFIAVVDFNNLVDESDEENNVDSVLNHKPGIPTTLLCDAALCTNNGTFFNSLEINCSGSTDPESDSITYSLDAFYSSGDLLTINSFNNSLQTENLSFGGNENKTRYLEISKNANVTSAALNLSSTSGGNPVFSDALTYYKLDETSGDAIDSVNGIYNATLINNVVQEQIGIINNSYNFSSAGDNGYLNVSHYNLGMGACNDFNCSISFWLNKSNSGIGSENEMMSFGNSTGETNFPNTISILIRGGGPNRGSIQVSVRSTGSLNDTFTSTNVSNGQWNHVVITFDPNIIPSSGSPNGTKISVYINGTLDNSTILNMSSFNTLVNNFTYFGITRHEANTDAYSGLLDEIGIWDRVITSQEASDLYNDGNGKVFGESSTITNPYLEVGTPDGIREWQYTGEFNQTNNRTEDFSSAINSALNNGACDCTGCVLSGDDCKIPFLFHSDTAGTLEYSDIRINYQTTGPAWSSIGNHSESSVLNWDISDIEPQSEVDLRCRAIDVEGSNTYSDYYDPNISISLNSGLNIADLNVVGENNTERIFRFVVNNTLGSAITDISWSLDTGESNESSQFNVTLQGGEDYFVYAYHNYTASGNYTVIASVTNGTYSDQESIIIEV